jgi:hypothetical protein
MDFPDHKLPLKAVVTAEDNLPEETPTPRNTPVYRWGTTAIGQAPGKVSEWFRRRTTAERGAWAWAAAIALLVFTLGVLSYSLRRQNVPGRPAPPQYLQLSVDRVGKSLRLHWDRNSSSIRGGAHAILHIQDGAQESDRNLTSSEFTAGSITYEPKSPEVTFRLDLFSGEPHAIGLVQVMFPPSPIPQTPTAGANLPPKLKPAPVAPVPANAPVARVPANAPVPTPKFNASSEAPPASRDSKAPASHIYIANYENRQVQLPAVRTSRESEITPLQTPVETSVVTTIDKPPRPSPTTPAPEVSVSDQKPSVQVSTEPVEGSRFGHMVGKIPILRRLKKPVKMAAPVPVYQVKPAVRMPDAEKLTRPVTIDVKVNVGGSGAVDRAEVIEYGDPPNFTLANAALAAARQWTFGMPRVEDGAISSELILHFYFSP